jgi:DegV family protein with EDD domain
MVKILTDSTNDLPLDVIKKLDIEVIPLYVNFGDESLKDGVDIKTEELYKRVSSNGVLPKTAAITIGDFETVFKKYLDMGYELVYTGISGAMSSTLNNARIAIENLDAQDKAYAIDSKNLSTGIGLLLFKACKDRDLGLNAREIAANMEKNTDYVLSQFAIEQMEYLHKGGRCSGVARFAATVLRIKPIIEVRGGKMDVQAKPIGKIKVALDRMLKQLISDKDRLDKDHIIVTHSMADESAKYLLAKIKEEFNDVDILETNAGCVISSHCGPGTIGILYMVNSK